MTTPQTGREYALWDIHHGWASQEVVGSHAYIANVQIMLGADFNPRGAELTRTLELIPEPDNPFDRFAVSVRFQDTTIGYLPRTDASRYHRPLLDLIALGFTPTVGARIWASERPEWDEDGTERQSIHTSIYLRLSSPATMTPLNDPPTEHHTTFPDGGSVQVLKAVDHFDILRRYPTDAGIGTLVVTLHAITLPSTRAVKRVVEIRLDGQRIGQLSPSMSEKYLPAIDHFESRGLHSAARAVLNASPVSAKVSLHAQKAFELSMDVLDGPPLTVPARGVNRPDLSATFTVNEIGPDNNMSGETVQTGRTELGSVITVTEQPATGLVTLSMEFAQPLTAWQSKVATKVLATAARLITSQGLRAQAASLTNLAVTASAPLDCAQEFVDALIGVEDSDFGAAQAFNDQ